MKKIWLHIGTHRTGSTSIQRTLHENRLLLLEQGFLFPHAGESMGSQHQLAWSLLEKLPPWYDKPESSEKVFKALRVEIESSDAEQIILSSEDFSLLDYQSESLNHLNLLASYLEDYDVHIIVYVREQIQFLNSFYNEVVKSYDTRFAGYSPMQLADELGSLLDYNFLIDRWGSVFGEKQIVVRDFNRAVHANGLVEDFLQTVGVDAIELDVYRSNSGISASLLRLKEAINAQNISPRFKHTLGGTMDKVSLGASPWVFSQEQTDSLRSRFKESNTTLKVRLPGLTLGCDEREGQSDLAGTVELENNEGLVAVVTHVSEQFDVLQNRIDRKCEELEMSQDALLLSGVQYRSFWKRFMKSMRYFPPVNFLLDNRYVKQYRRVISSSYFDEIYYLKNNPDVVISKIPAAWHFLKIGGAEGRNPSNNFSSIDYMQQHSEVDFSKVNPLVDFLDRSEAVRKERASSFKNAKNVEGLSIVVIDHEIPRYDDNAGGRHTFQYLKMFAGAGMKVTFIPYMVPAGESLRVAEELENAGVIIQSFSRADELETPKDLVKDWLLKRIDSIDVIYLHRPHIAKRYLPFLKEFGGLPVWYMCHDLHFIRLFRQGVQQKSIRLFLSSVKMFFSEYIFFQQADLCLTPSDTEEQIVRLFMRVRAVSSIPLYVYDNERFAINSRKSNDVIFIGSFHHEPNCDAVRWLLEEIWPKVLTKSAELRLVIIGKDPPEDFVSMGRNMGQVDFAGFVSDDLLHQKYLDAAAMVVPLRYGAGVKGKVVEALRYGVPLSATGCALEGIDGMSSVACEYNSADELADEIISLSRMNEDNRGSLSTRMTELFERNFSRERAMKTFFPSISV